MPNVNGKKFPYTPAGMAAAKKAAAKKPGKPGRMTKPMPTRKPRPMGRMTRRKGM